MDMPMTDPTVRTPIPDAPPPSDRPPGASDPTSPIVPPASATPTAAVAAPPPPAAAPPPPAAPLPSRSRATTDDPGRWGGIIAGLVLVAVGVWFFADQTLGLAMPDVDWGRFWPVILILIGAWIVLGSRRRGAS
jgi:hypothetical protein